MMKAMIYSSKDILDFNAVVLSVRNILEGLAAKVTAMDATPKHSLVEPIKEAPDAAQKDTPEEMQKETALQLKEGPETTRKETQQENLDETPESDEQH